MTTFDDREKAFENRFAHDQEFAFRAEARRNRRVGLWAAELMGKGGTSAEDYAAEILAAAVDGGSEAVVERIERDFAAARIQVSDHQVRRKMETVLAEVAEALKAE